MTESSNYRNLNGIHILRLTGNYRERAKQHGILLRDQIKNGPLVPLAKKNEWLIRRAGGPFDFKPLQDLVVWMYHNWVVRKLEKALPNRQHHIMAELSKESGLSYQTVLRAMFQADGLMLLSRISMFKHLFKNFPASELPGCSSSVVHGALTANGKMLVSRNQDYPVVGPWEQNTTVAYHYPEEQDEIPHVTVASAGLHTSGLTAMNREGITVAAHAHFGKEVSFNGLPIFVVGDLIASKAKTLGQAVDLARKAPRNANWTLVISSAKEKNAMALEMTPYKLEPRYLHDGFLTHTNFFHGKLHESEALICGGRHHDDHARLCRMKQVILKNKGAITPQILGQMLGDHTDPWTGEERVVGNTISVMSTIKSVVFSPEDQEFFISGRGQSPMGLGPFYQLNATDFWEHPFDKAPATPAFQGKLPATPHLLEAIGRYREAYRCWHMDSHRADYKEKTLSHLEAAYMLAPNDPHVALQTGFVAMKCRHFAKAATYLEKTMAMKLAPYLAEVRDLFLARAYDNLNHRDKALNLYKKLISHQDPRIHKQAKKGLNKPFAGNQVAKLMLDMQFVDPIAY